MENLINFGIDLGTTNSVITQFVKGEVKIFNNPQDYGRCTLPSVVGFRKDRIIVGTKAKELSEKDPKNVVAAFKRKMGTTESYKIKSLNESKTPVELSSLVIKELKTFVSSSEELDAIVITIPASFDTIQSNATKEAGLLSGFKQVVLLQEPIAASLAYANMKKNKDLKEGQWLVYDLGGGTFDVALVKIINGEMKVIDHEGDNFLGGTDFDNIIVEKFIIPKIEEKYNFENLLNDMISESGKLNSKYYVLLHSAEKAKIDLSAKTSTEIIIDGFEDDDNEEVDFEITITRSEFNNLIKEYIKKTTDMVKSILTRNSLQPNDIQFTLIVGGSTFIPFVRQNVEEVLQIPVNCEIDPTTAVGLGAAYYASTKVKELSTIKTEKKNVKISIKAAYQKASKEKEEFFAARITGNIEGLFYRITRNDQGYDSGLKQLKEKISEDLPLVENAFNYFKFTVYDEKNNIIETDFDTIGINSGYSISGQPLPEDICLEVDDLDNPCDTKLELIFQRNTPLPVKKTITKCLTKTIIKGSNEDLVRINILEGPHYSIPEANKCIGFMGITGINLSRDISKGSDIEITIEISESRDITISAYLTMSDQEFKQTFTPKARQTDIETLKFEISKLNNSIDDEIDAAVSDEKYEKANELKKIKKEIEKLEEETSTMNSDDVTDKKYQIEDSKRKIAQEVHNVTKDKKMAALQSEYFGIKEECHNLLKEHGNDHEMKHFNDIVNREDSFLTSVNTTKIQEAIEQLHSLHISVLFRVPSFLKAVFIDISKNKASKLNDQEQAKSLIDSGKLAIASENWDRLREIISGLMSLLPKTEQKKINYKVGF